MRNLLFVVGALFLVYLTGRKGRLRAGVPAKVQDTPHAAINFMDRT